jgi:hypothetical protein
MTTVRHYITKTRVLSQRFNYVRKVQEAHEGLKLGGMHQLLCVLVILTY